MHKRLLSAMFFNTILLTLVLPILGQAQITIDDQDILNMLGTVVEAEIDTNGNVSIDIGSAGQNQTWDFSSMTVNGYKIPIEYIIPDGTPFAENFPGANFVQKSEIKDGDIEAEIYTYHDVNSKEFTHLGNGIISGDFKLLQPGGEEDAPLPVTYGSEWTVISADTIFIVDGFYIVTKSTFTNIVDSWGTLKLPIGDFASLRIKDEALEISETYVNNVLTSSDTSRNINYSWVGKNTIMLLYAESDDGITDPDFNTAREFGWITKLTTTDINKDLTQNIPNKYKLDQNYPNPFNPETIISYSLPQKSDVSISIYDITGRLIDNIIPGLQSAGIHEVRWQAAHHLASGAYMYRIHAGDFVSTKKMILLR